MEPTLFSDLPDAPEGGFTLWFRPFKNGDGKRRRWEVVGTAATESELIQLHMAGGGEFMILAVGREPGPDKQM